MKFSSLILATVLSTTGCIAKKMAISNADSLISNQVNKRLHLASSDQDSLKKDIGQFLNGSKARALELKELIVQIDLEKPENISKSYSSIEKIYKIFVIDFTKDVLVEKLSRINPEQQKDLMEYYTSETQKITKKSKEQRLEGLAKRFNYLFNEAQKPQKEIFESYESYLSEQAQSRVQRRTKLQETLRNLLSAGLPMEVKEAKILEAILSHQEQSLAGNKTLEIIQKLIPTLNAEQKSAFKKNRKEILELLDHFMKQKY